MAQVVNYYYKQQILKSSRKREAKRSFTVSVKTPKGTEEKPILKSTAGMACLGGSARSK
jgi:hypothetical protein